MRFVFENQWQSQDCLKESRGTAGNPLKSIVGK